jgi:hypothetical protein
VLKNKKQKTSIQMEVDRTFYFAGSAQIQNSSSRNLGSFYITSSVKLFRIQVSKEPWKKLSLLFREANFLQIVEHASIHEVHEACFPLHETITATWGINNMAMITI